MCEHKDSGSGLYFFAFQRQLLGKGGEALCGIGLDFKRGREEERKGDE